MIWCLFDWINFYFFAPPAWTYLGMPGSRGIAGGFAYRFVGYFISFGTVVPGMLLSGQMLLSSGGDGLGAGAAVADADVGGGGGIGGVGWGCWLSSVCIEEFGARILALFG